MARVRLKRLRVAFTSEAAFVAEYKNNIANGGIFLATDKSFSPRDPVEVELRLDYCKEVVKLRGEVVHSVPVEMASTGAVPGVAVQFALEGPELREKFGPLAGELDDSCETIDDVGRRQSARSPARVNAEVHGEDGSDFAARTKDISKTGVLISTGGANVPVGQSLKLDLTHPISGERMSVSGKVVRQVHGSDGTITALGIEFDIAADGAPELGRFVDRVKATEHSRRLGIIQGTIEGYGFERLLRMFAGAAPRGTFSIFRKGDEGAIIFNETGFVAAYFGRLTDREALAEMLMWSDGDFEFEIAVEPIFRNFQGRPLDEVLDEVKGMSAGSLQASASADRGPASALLKARIQVNVAALDSHVSELSKSEEAVIDLAIVGMLVRKVVKIIPEPEARILSAIESLVEQGLVIVEA